MKFPQIAKQQISKSDSLYLDLVRSCAAVYVMLNHIVSVLFPPASSLHTPDFWRTWFYRAFGQGRFAVLIFFLLSGFVIASSIFRAHASGRWSFNHYFFQRLTRLWVVLVPCLLLTLFWDRLGLAMFGHDAVYSGRFTQEDGLDFPVATRLSPIVFLGNAFFLQTIRTPTFGSNNPLWSLAYEFWFYLLFPVLLGICRPRSAPRMLAHVVALAAIVLLVGKYVTVYFAIWLLGVVLVFAPRVRFRRRALQNALVILSWALYAASIVATVSLRRPHTDVLRECLISGFGLVALYLGICPCDEPKGRPVGGGAAEPIIRRMAGMSFTLYLAHFPIVAFVWAASFQPNRPKWPLDVPHVLLAAGLAVAILGYAFAVASLTESKTDRVRSYLTHRFGKFFGLART